MALAAAPEYLKKRVAWGKEFASVEVAEEGKGEQQLVACVKYTVERMPMDVLLELGRILVPTWAPVKGL